MNRCKDSLTIRNAIDELERAANWLERFAEAASVDPAVISGLQVAMDEVLSNVINHGFSGAAVAQHDIGLDVRRLPDRVELEISDDGPEFDPTGAALAPVGAAAEGPRLGGAGLLFVRSLMDDMRYQRKAGLNCLVLTKRLPVADAREGEGDGNP